MSAHVLRSCAAMYCATMILIIHNKRVLVSPSNGCNYLYGFNVELWGKYIYVCFLSTIEKNISSSIYWKWHDESIGPEEIRVRKLIQNSRAVSVEGGGEVHCWFSMGWNSCRGCAHVNSLSKNRGDRNRMPTSSMNHLDKGFICS